MSIDKFRHKYFVIVSKSPGPNARCEMIARSPSPSLYDVVFFIYILYVLSMRRLPIGIWERGPKSISISKAKF
jgi:hypothetical protein